MSKALAIRMFSIFEGKPALYIVLVRCKIEMNLNLQKLRFIFGVIRSLTNSKRDVTDRTMSISLEMSISHEYLK